MIPQYPTQPNYPETELTSPCSILLINLMLSARLGSDECQLLSHWFDSTRVRTSGFDSLDLPRHSTHSAISSGLHLVGILDIALQQMIFCL